MADQDPPKRRGRPPKYGQRQNFSFRITDEMRQRLIDTVKRSGRSLSEEIEHRVELSYLCEIILGDLEQFKARTIAVEAHQQGYGKIWGVDGPTYLEPGTHNLPKSGEFVSAAEAAAPLPALPPAIREEIRGLIKDVLEEAGLARKKSDSAAA